MESPSPSFRVGSLLQGGRRQFFFLTLFSPFFPPPARNGSSCFFPHRHASCARADELPPQIIQLKYMASSLSPFSFLPFEFTPCIFVLPLKPPAARRPLPPFLLTPLREECRPLFEQDSRSATLSCKTDLWTRFSHSLPEHKQSLPPFPIGREFPFPLLTFFPFFPPLKSFLDANFLPPFFQAFA